MDTALATSRDHARNATLNRWIHGSGRLKNFHWRISFNGSDYRGELTNRCGAHLVNAQSPDRGTVEMHLAHGLEDLLSRW